jgi:hypothetical protein
MDGQWRNFLRNLGAWRGSFANLTPTGELQDRTASLLTLEAADDDRLVIFSLRRWPTAEPVGEPSRAVSQEYRSLGRQVVFFETGAFCKGSLQVAPATVFGGEFAFVTADRRHRLVHLTDAEGVPAQLVLIREQREGSTAPERPAATPEQLRGPWQGQATTISADWWVPATADCRYDLADAGPEGWCWLPDGGFCRLPARVSHREAFSVEAGWLAAPDRLERLIRRYDASGAWTSATHEVLSRG